MKSDIQFPIYFQSQDINKDSICQHGPFDIARVNAIHLSDHSGTSTIRL
jgi:hypothetical protein